MSQNIDIPKNMDLRIFFQYNKLLNQKINFTTAGTFNISENKSELLDTILNTNIGHKFNTIDHTTFELIKTKLFNDFKIRHDRTNYYKLFHQKKLNKENYFTKYRKIKGQTNYHYTEDIKCENQVHFSQLREVFQKILYKVVSQELIGNYRNKKKILKTLHNFTLTAKTESFTLLSLIKQINISSIKWLKNIQDQQTKYILIAKFIKWLFQYFIQIIYYQFHVTYIKEERIFIFLKDWKIKKTSFFKKMNINMFLEPNNEINISKIQNRLILIPKRIGVRYITIQKYTDEEKQTLRKIISILKYLYETNLKNTDNSFNKKYFQLFKEYHSYKNNKIYIISSDISNAYNSIIQAKLFDIVMEMYEELPNKLILRQYIISNSKKYKYVNTSTNLYKVKNENVNEFEIIEKNYILKLIKEFIYNTKIVINNKVYNLCKGLAQGLMLSAILCDIYYAHMRMKYFSDFEKSGYYFAYVDDSIFFTKSLIFANQYINKIKKGIPEYNCWFNKSKLKYNFNNYNNSDSNKIEYLGWTINSNSLEIWPKYSSARYSINYTSLNYLICDFKMQHLASLKLNKLILHKKINSEKQILNNVKLIALHHAKRCYAIANFLYENQCTLKIKSFKQCNLKILYKIKKLTEWDENEKRQIWKKLQYIIWRAFYDIFNRKRIIFLYLIKEFQKLIKIYKI